MVSNNGIKRLKLHSEYDVEITLIPYNECKRDFYTLPFNTLSVARNLLPIYVIQISDLLENF